MTTSELSEFAGDKTPYNPIFEALMDSSLPIGEESAAFARGVLERLMLNDMTYAHDAIKRALGAGTFSMKNDKGKGKGKGKTKEKSKGKKDPAKGKKDDAAVKKTLNAALKKVGPKAQAFVEALRKGTDKKALEKMGSELELAQMEAVESALAEFPDNDNQALKLLREMLKKSDPKRGDKFKTKPPLASNSKERFNL
jgi:hypothetical protein